MDILEKTFFVIAILMSLFSNYSALSSISVIKSDPVFSKTIFDFCKSRKGNEDQSFCLDVFKSDPRSVTANDFLTIIQIAVDSASGDAKNAQSFFDEISKNNGTKEPGLKAVAKECIDAYNGAMGEWKAMINTFKNEGPYYATYEGMRALDEILRCNQTLVDSKISSPGITSRIEVALAHGNLNVAVADAATNKP